MEPRSNGQIQRQMILPRKKSESKQARERAILKARNIAAGTVTAELQSAEDVRSYYRVSRPRKEEPTTARDGPAIFTLETRVWHWSPEDQAEVDRIVGKAPQIARRVLHNSAYGV